MAATRKLQGEIDRCLKKVTEGVETFEDIWQKVHNATNSNQKEKYEADLKKEIKKLQRLRDQIKSWIASGEIKDKSTLMENRKLIETQMERFKVVERETKTKAYSKEGLGAVQKLDPAQKERDEMQQWLVSSIDQLNIQTDSFECEIESLLANKKKKLDKEKQERMDELKSRLEKHRFHIRKLETLLRMLDNMSVEVSQIRNIKDDVEYYIESSQDPDFGDNELIYDDIIGLDEIEISGGVPLPSSATTDSNDTGGTPTSLISGSSPILSPPPSTIQTYNHSSDSSNDADKKSTNKDQPKPLKPTPIKATSGLNTTTTSVLGYSLNSCTIATPVCKTSIASSTPNRVTTSSTVIHETSPVSQSNTTSNFAAVAANITNLISKSDPSSVNGAAISDVSTIPIQTTTANSTSQLNQIQMTQVPLHSGNSAQKLYIEQHLSDCDGQESTGDISTTNDASQAVTNGSAIDMINDGMSLKNIAQQAIDKAQLDSQVILEPSKNQSQGKSEAHIPPLLGVAPLGAVPLQKEHQQQFQLMEAAFYHMPQPSDSERIRTYLPRQPFSTPTYYNQTPLAHSDSLEFYQRLATETLFFVFYYMEGTKAQYLAAKALKKQSWRFHTKYMMWFQRHEEPKIINEEFEQGTYIYFDYEKWGQRKKEGFTFEYKYLEDREIGRAHV